MPEDSFLHSHRSRNLKSYKYLIIILYNPLEGIQDFQDEQMLLI
jgi:hypothetical protein